MKLNKIVSYMAVVALAGASVVLPVLAVAQTAMTVSVVAPAHNATITVGQTVAFTAQATGGNGLYSYAWDFGNGQQASGRVFDQVYNTVGDYVVTLVASDTAGSNASANITVHVVAGTNPTTLTISNVRVTDITSSSVVVRWETNLPASSRVIYDTVSHASAVGAAGSNYGYANTTVATDVAPNGVTAHAVTISGLAPATTYYFRAISQ